MRPSSTAFLGRARASMPLGGAPPPPPGAPPAPKAVMEKEVLRDETADDDFEGAELDASAAAMGPPAEEEPEPAFEEARRQPRKKAEKKKEVADERTRTGSFAMRSLKARLVLLKDGRLAVQFVVDGGGLDWRPKLATVHLKNGDSVTATIDTALTTREAMLPAGLTVALALNVPALAAEPRSIQVIGEGGVLLLELGQ